MVTRSDEMANLLKEIKDIKEIVQKQSEDLKAYQEQETKKMAKVMGLCIMIIGGLKDYIRISIVGH